MFKHFMCIIWIQDSTWCLQSIHRFINLLFRLLSNLNSLTTKLKTFCQARVKDQAKTRPIMSWNKTEKLLRIIWFKGGSFKCKDWFEQSHKWWWWNLKDMLSDGSMVEVRAEDMAIVKGKAKVEDVLLPHLLENLLEGSEVAAGVNQDRGVECTQTSIQL